MSEQAQRIDLKPTERLDYLLDRQLKIIQSPEVFSFSMDAVLLAHFTSVPIQRGRIIDLCAGNGAIPLLLSKRSRARIEAVEIQERLADMAQRSVQWNGLEEQITVHQLDLKDAPSVFGYGQFDTVTCNPPYLSPESGDTHLNPHHAYARHELLCTLEDVIRISADLTKPGGKAAFVHRPHRLLDILLFMRRYKLEPKRLRFVHPRQGKEANMLLVEGIKDGKAELKLLPPLTVYGEGQTYTEELMRIYNPQATEEGPDPQDGCKG
jgi:tRNA1(Val) A37 N6-methylase TrmN6